MRNMKPTTMQEIFDAFSDEEKRIWIAMSEDWKRLEEENGGPICPELGPSTIIYED
jgi:hypothetical protein